MAQSISTREPKATSAAENLIEQAWKFAHATLLDVVASTLSEEATPASFAAFEQEPTSVLREVGRNVVEQTVNEMNTNAMRQMVIFRGLIYRQLKKKTRNQHISTSFGNITVERFEFRYYDDKHGPEPCIFPLELKLGLIEGVTPALGSQIGKQMARTTQQQTIDWLREEHNVHIGTGRLRKFIAQLSPLMAEHQHELQVRVLLDAMNEANNSQGSRTPVLAVGRDGVTMCENRHSLWEVATTSTVTVFDRCGKRLLTIYLAYGPELGQSTMSRQLTVLITDLLANGTDHCQHSPTFLIREAARPATSKMFCAACGILAPAQASFGSASLTIIMRPSVFGRLPKLCSESEKTSTGSGRVEC